VKNSTARHPAQLVQFAPLIEQGEVGDFGGGDPDSEGHEQAEREQQNKASERMHQGSGGAER
jgi:hypothetical protein